MINILTRVRDPNYFPELRERHNGTQRTKLDATLAAITMQRTGASRKQEQTSRLSS